MAPITLLLCREFSLSIRLFSTSFEQREIPFFLEAERSFVFEIACLLLHEVLDSFRAEYLVFDLPISASSVA